jgi:hypothetical protein
LITDFIVKAVAGLLTGLLAILPDWTVDTSALDTARHLVVTVASLDGWVPETFIFSCLGLMLGVRLFFLVLNGIQWLYHLIPFNGG